MTAPDPAQLSLRQIEAGDSVTGFSLGDPKHKPLKTFLRKYAKEYHQRDLSKTYVLVTDNGRVWAYVSLSSSQVELDGPGRPQDAGSFPYKYFPAIKITRLAVDQRLRGKGLGLFLLDFAVALVKEEISPRIGCRFIVVDAKKDVVHYYVDRAGFTLLDTDANRKSETPLVFLDLQRI